MRPAERRGDREASSVGWHPACVAHRGAAVTTGCGVDTSNPDKGTAQGFGSQDASKDVKVTDLESDSLGGNTVKLKITNHSPKASDYDITATLYDKKGIQVGEASDFVQRVAPHKTARTELPGDNTETASKVKITEVDRTASSE